MKSHRAFLTSMLMAWFLAIPLLGPDGTFPMCLKDGKPVECEKWQVLARFEQYDDCLDKQLEIRTRGLQASHDIPSAAHNVQDLRASCIREGDPRLPAQ